MTKDQERVIISNGAFDFACEVEDVTKMLYSMWERYFSAADGAALSAGEAAELGAVLRVATNALFNVLRDFRVSVGEDGPGVDTIVALVHEYDRIKAVESKAVRGAAAG